MQLSDAQRAAVENTEGQVILISCPGSGKTSTVVRRVAHMVNEKHIPPEQILVLTFSKAAAMEMKERYDKLSSTPKQDTGCAVNFSTIHAFCYSIISYAFKLKAENILRENEAWMIIRKGLDGLKKRGILKMSIRDYSDFTSSCLREISVVNNNGVDWNSYRSQTCPTEEFHAIYNLYQEEKQKLGKIDFDDMLRICYDLLLNNADYLNWYRSRYRYIIVDEYQDTNFLQRDIIYLLAGSPGEANLCVVGDDDQSIYKFRGAKPEIMLNFAKEYPNCKQIYMDVNYRSQPCIIEHARRLIEHNKFRFAKDIKPFKTEEGIVSQHEQKTVLGEVYGIVKLIQEKEKSKEYSFDDIAVLYRNNSQAVFLAAVLLGNEIPFHSNDSLQSMYRHWIFSDLMAFYKLSKGTGSNQNLIQVINKPNRFLPVEALKHIPINEKSVVDAIRKFVTNDWKKSKAIEQIHDFFLNLKLLSDKTDPNSFLLLVRKMIEYDTYLRSYASYRNMDLRELTGILDSYANDIKNNNITTMEDWIAYAEKTNALIDEINANKSKSGVTLSTMHSSKGLEFPVVMILGADEDVIPSPRAESDEMIEEERRLFYVAVTRAMNELHIFYAKSNNGSSGKSRFVSEMQEEKRQEQRIVYEAKFNKGQRVVHKQYGKGIVISKAENVICVKFDAHPILLKFEGDKMKEIAHCSR